MMQRGPRSLLFTPITPTNNQVAAGGAGWVDTDVSAVAGTDTSRVWLCFGYAEGGGFAVQGVRTHGSAVDAKQNLGPYCQAVKVDSAGHVDIYRNAAVAANVFFMGYFS